MKKFLLISNIILLFAVAFLYYEYYSYKNFDLHNINNANAAVSNTLKIVYFDLDTLQNQYKYFEEVRDYLNAKDSGIQAELNRLRNEYVNKVKEYNQKGPGLSQTQQSDYEQQLVQMKNAYDDRSQTLQQAMQVEYVQKMQEVKSKIQTFLKSYCKDKGYAYVFASSDNDYLYYKDTIRNITPEIVVKLNELYWNDKKK